MAGRGGGGGSNTPDVDCTFAAEKAYIMGWLRTSRASNMPNLQELGLKYKVHDWDQDLGILGDSRELRLGCIYPRWLELSARGMNPTEFVATARCSYSSTFRYSVRGELISSPKRYLRDIRLVRFFENLGDDEGIARLGPKKWTEALAAARDWSPARRTAFNSVKTIA